MVKILNKKYNKHIQNKLNLDDIVRSAEIRVVKDVPELVVEVRVDGLVVGREVVQ